MAYGDLNKSRDAHISHQDWRQIFLERAQLCIYVAATTAAMCGWLWLLGKVSLKLFDWIGGPT
jgi:hypothetical protein